MPTSPGRRRFAVRRSPIHGRGVYATTDLTPGEDLLDYRGEIISWEVATERYDRREPGTDSTTYFFDLGDGTVIDGNANGNSARYINHGCAPNCEAIDTDGRIHIRALTAIRPGEELLIDYALIVDEPEDPETRELYSCRCGAAACRRTMIATSEAP